MSTFQQLALSEIFAVNDGVVSPQGDAVVVVTDPRQWSYGAEAVFNLSGIECASRIVRIRLQVHSGVFGIGWLQQDETGWAARASAGPSDEIVERHLVVPAAISGRRMVFDNWSEDGERAHAVIYSIDAGPVVDPRVEDLWPLPAEFGVTRLRAWSEEELRSQLTGDALRDNLILNKWEFATGKTVLQSYPWRLSVPFVLCNAQCEFCAAWSIKGNIRLDDLIASLIPVIRHCYQLDLVGWGEPLIHPQFATILDFLKREADPRARLALTTNGTRLDEWTDRLLAANVMSYAISIHAATSATHQDLMGFGPEDFDRVVAAAGTLIARKREFPNIKVELVLVVTQQNLAEIAAFIAMAEYLGADQVNLRTLMPMGAPREELDYHRLPPYRHPQFELLRAVAITAISHARLPVKGDPASWSHPLFAPEWEAQLDSLPLRPRQGRRHHRAKPLDWDTLGAGEASGEPEPCVLGANLYDRHAPLYCPSPYTAFYVNGTDRRVIPCVYMHKVRGHEFIHFKPSMRFEEAWNSPAMVAVRRSLNEGPLMPECLKCPFHCG